MKVELLVDAEGYDEEGNLVHQPAGLIIDHPDAWKLVGVIVDRTYDASGKIVHRGTQRKAKPVDDEARERCAYLYEKEERALRGQRQLTKVYREQQLSDFAKQMGIEDYGTTEQGKQVGAGDAGGSGSGAWAGGPDSSDVVADAEEGL